MRLGILRSFISTTLTSARMRMVKTLKAKFNMKLEGSDHGEYCWSKDYDKYCRQ